ncbi:MAG: radical SAM protein [Oscillospiraceae bacterium]|jgi:MoaA/NifB/PqqE/SkfB family radical SAM enzyme|nr:radical SAM protein [Oscillospiraceae bacterium]
MNQYIDISRIEFVITNACTGKCKHCSNGEQTERGSSINADVAADVVRRIAERFNVQSVMTFGGEPLLYPDTVCQIHSSARGCGIPTRQIITNGSFSRDRSRIDHVAKALCNAGITDVLLSVDAFHQEFLPLDYVMYFAESLLKYNVPSLRVHPAWLAGEDYSNKENEETKRLLAVFSEMGISASDGNAAVNFPEYFPSTETIDFTIPCGEMEYTAPLDDVGSLSIRPNGDVELCSISIGNIYATDILQIIDDYDPYVIPAANAVLTGGVSELVSFAESQGVIIDTNGCYSVCAVCRKAMTALALLPSP